ncbi:VWA domain-containing protein [Kitasatospora sp. NPDC005748]|uniref:VWA domain-containing protein n=1 Tax=Kitasatospora sp. NPDC005748 TaxID=3157063 RepID=UPI0033CBE93F
MNLFSRKTTPAPQPGNIVNLVKTASVSLTKHGLNNERAAVYLVLDHSGSMVGHYASGDVQRLAEQALGLSANLDDDGNVPMIMFSSHASSPINLDLTNYAGVVEREHQRANWGSTNYAAALASIVHHYRQSGATAPALVIFQTDGEPDSRAAAEQALRDASRLPIFWAFVGFGGRVNFLERLDTLGGRAVDNASFFHAARPAQVSDTELYDGITREYAQWLTAARANHIIP